MNLRLQSGAARMASHRCATCAPIAEHKHIAGLRKRSSLRNDPDAWPTATTAARTARTPVATRAAVAAGANLRRIVRRAEATSRSGATRGTAAARAAGAAGARLDRVAGDGQGRGHADDAERAASSTAATTAGPGATAGATTAATVAAASRVESATPTTAAAPAAVLA